MWMPFFWVRSLFSVVLTLPKLAGCLLQAVGRRVKKGYRSGMPGVGPSDISSRAHHGSVADGFIRKNKTMFRSRVLAL